MNDSAAILFAISLLILAMAVMTNDIVKAINVNTEAVAACRAATR